MVHRPRGTPLFEFVTIAALRAAQLMQGSTPRLSAGTRATVTAQREVAAGLVAPLARVDGPTRVAVGGPPELERVRRSNGSGKDRLP